MNIPESTISELLRVDNADWINELESTRLFFESLGEKLPKTLKQELEKLIDRLGANTHS
jgi:GTP-dependent phosphoenolpyruvate carboxykinase